MEDEQHIFTVKVIKRSDKRRHAVQKYDISRVTFVLL